jgi:hypothetical protein
MKRFMILFPLSAVQWTEMNLEIGAEKLLIPRAADSSVSSKLLNRQAEIKESAHR